MLNTYPSDSGANHWTIVNPPDSSGNSLAIIASAPVFSLPNSGVAHVSSLGPYVRCLIGFGPDTQSLGVRTSCSPGEEPPLWVPVYPVT